MGCCVSRRRHEAVCQELQVMQDEQALRTHQADGYCRARGQAIKDRNHLMDAESDVVTLQKQLFSTSADLMELSQNSEARVVFVSLPLKTGLAFKATLL